MEHQFKLGSKRGAKRSTSAALVVLLLASGIPFVAMDAAAAYTWCFTINQYGWTGEIGKSTNAGLSIKNLVEDGTYYVQFANVPWIELDTDVDVLRVFAATQNSCTGSDFGTFYQVDISYTTAAGATNDDGYSQTFHIYVQYGEDSIVIITETASGATRQGHPVYWDVAPCYGCGTVEGSDDYITIDASTGAGSTNIAWQELETQYSEMVYRNYVYKVFDYASAGTVAYMMKFWAYDFSVYDEPTRTDAWALYCSSCGEGSSQYNNGPWDFQTNQGIFGGDVQLVVQHQRYTGSAGWTSLNTMAI